MLCFDKLNRECNNKQHFKNFSFCVSISLNCAIQIRYCGSPRPETTNAAIRVVIFNSFKI